LGKADSSATQFWRQNVAFTFFAVFQAMSFTVTKTKRKSVSTISSRVEKKTRSSEQGSTAYWNCSCLLGCDKCQTTQQKSPKNLTPFTRKVYAFCKLVPPGHICTYKDLAEAIGVERGYRAVGNALRNNPFAPTVPCHRILKSDWSIGGFSGETGAESIKVQRKIQLLKAEGIEFNKTSTELRVDQLYRAKVRFDFKSCDRVIGAKDLLSEELARRDVDPERDSEASE